MRIRIPLVSSRARALAQLLLVSLLLAASPAAQTARQQATRGQGTLLFVVTGEGEGNEKTMDALVLIEGGRYREPTGGDPQGRDLTPFANAYLRAGQKYRLLFGGGEAGSVTVRKSQQGCNNIHADVDVETQAKLSGRVMALATNSQSLGRKPVSRRAPTDAERASVMELVKSIYRRKGTTVSLLRQLETRNLTATDLDGDGTFEIVGSFRLGPKNGDKGMRRDLFLIAAQRGGAYTAELAEYQAYRLVEGFGRGVDFVDQLDMDGDGQAEVVTVNEGFDAYSYSIYKKRRGVWRDIFTSTGDAC